MKSTFTIIVASLMLAFASTAYAGLELIREGNAASVIGDQMVTDFPLGIDTSGQPTSTGCLTNDQEGYFRTETPIEQLPLEEENYDTSFPVSFDSASFSSTPPSSPNQPRTPSNRGGDDDDDDGGGDDGGGDDPPKNTVTPEPTTMLIFGIGIATLVPLARRRRR